MGSPRSTTLCRCSKHTVQFPSLCRSLQRRQYGLDFGNLADTDRVAPAIQQQDKSAVPRLDEPARALLEKPRTYGTDIAGFAHSVWVKIRFAPRQCRQHQSLFGNASTETGTAFGDWITLDLTRNGLEVQFVE